MASEPEPVSSPTAEQDPHPQQPSTEHTRDPSMASTTLDADPAAFNSDARPSPPQHTNSSWEPRKCWICFSDETEDTPETTRWVTPCACALTAHEGCILDWVADLEAPQNARRPRQQIACPQCKTPIAIDRPRSILVSGVSGVERLLGRLTVPGLLATALGAVAAGAWVHGLASVYVVFGPADFEELLGVGSDEGTGVRAALGTALVPVALVASRLRAADGLLPMLPVFFLASRFPATERRRLVAGAPLRWPPSAAMAFASLPYLRGVYNELWRHLVAEHERRWIAEVQPRASEDDAAQDAQPNGAHQVINDRLEGPNGVVELQLEINAGADAAPGPDNNALPGRANRIVNSSGRVADAVMGALCFPAVAAVAGELLRRSLPATYVGPAAPGSRLGMLQTRWGRSLVGGCLFVVVKDALLLYSRYRLAQNHRKRHVVNYDRRRRGEEQRGT